MEQLFGNISLKSDDQKLKEWIPHLYGALVLWRLMTRCHIVQRRDDRRQEYSEPMFRNRMEATK